MMKSFRETVTRAAAVALAVIMLIGSGTAAFADEYGPDDGYAPEYGPEYGQDPENEQEAPDPTDILRHLLPDVPDIVTGKDGESVKVPVVKERESSVTYKETAEYKNGPVEAKAECRADENEAGYEAGVGVQADKDGKTSVGAVAKAGAKHVSQSAEAEVSAGNDKAGVGMKVKADAGTAEANAKAQATVNENGEVTIEAGGSAEANAARVSAEGTVRVGDHEVRAKGSLKIGFGVNGKFRYEDGKITVRAGASLGLGVEGELTVDTAPCMDDIMELSGKIAGAVNDVRDAADAAGVAADAARKAAARKAEQAGDAVNAGREVIRQQAERTKDAVNAAKEAVKDQIKKAGSEAVKKGKELLDKFLGLFGRKKK